ncbi:Hypothetical predicted protein [Cloeon dipterum]|uniref:Uncharacterized protein n=1 Tax=Cloeon dipterum TaxID=197152 RepID=A0A8S1E3P4_9INSE|nr:Hypothetical predicted protein [Cloeon dipterum]
MVHKDDASLFREIGHFGESVMHIGAAFADERMCRWLLAEAHADVHALSQGNEASVLHCAAQNKSHGCDLVKFFVVCGLDVNARDKGDLTPLHHALKVEILQVAQQLLDLGADMKNLLHFCIKSGKLLSAKFVHGKDGEQVKRKSGGKNALHLAAEFGQPEMSEWLIKDLGVNVLSLEENNKNTVLHYAARNKRHGSELVRYLNQCGIYVNALNAHQMTPLHFALGSGNVDAAQVLIELGASWSRVEQSARNLVHFCAQQNQLHSLIFLHLQNCDLFTQKGPHGETALHFAARFADPDVCQWLVTKKGADASASCGGRSVLHFAATNKLHGKQLIRHFASFQLNIDGKSSLGKTPLHFALGCGNFAAAAELLELDADFRVKIGGGFNLLHFCVAEKRLDSAKFVHEKDEGMIHELGRGRESSLHIAAKGGDLEMCRWVVQQGVDVHARNAEGKSAFDYVASRELKQFFYCLGKRTPHSADQH